MRKSISFLCWMSMVLFSASTMAADRVVIIPLLEQTVQAPPAPSGTSVAIYDARDNFVSYYVGVPKQSHTYVTPLFVSPQGYYSNLNRDGTHNHSWTTTGYSDRSCLWVSPYVALSSAGSESFVEPLKGWVGEFKHAVAGTMGIYYIPQNATPWNPTMYYKQASGLCMIGPHAQHYQLLPNNPAITGFNNIYTGPLKASVTTPTTP